MPLKTKHKTYIYLLLSFISVSIIALCMYYLMGGFKEVLIVESRNNLYSVAGKDFIGSYSNDTLKMHFEEMRMYVEEGTLNGDLCLINYQDDHLADKQVHQFIGVLLGDEISEIPSGLKVRELEGETTFKAALAMHPLVRPNAEKVQTMLLEFAQKKGYDLKNYSLEIFYPDNSVIIEMFGTESDR